MKRNVRRICAAALVILALAEILCEDFAVFFGLPLAVRRLILCAGFGFDLVFTLWFLVGLYAASLNRKTRRFLVSEGGWMDLLASVPLLVLCSGPAMFSLAAGGVPLIPAAARITRDLRFLRFLKIFRLDLFPARGKTGAAFFAAILVFAAAFLIPLISRPGVPEKRILDSHFSAALRLSHEALGGENLVREIGEYGRTEPDLLLVKREASPLYSRYDFSYYNRYYSRADYLWIRGRNMEFYFSLKPLLAEEARFSISCFCVFAALCLACFFRGRVRINASG
jgi:hypothetical protein